MPDLSEALERVIYYSKCIQYTCTLYSSKYIQTHFFVCFVFFPSIFYVFVLVVGGRGLGTTHTRMIYRGCFELRTESTVLCQHD